MIIKGWYLRKNLKWFYFNLVSYTKNPRSWSPETFSLHDLWRNRTYHQGASWSAPLLWRKAPIRRMSHLSSYMLPVRRDQSQPRSMHLYPVVHQLNQQVRDGMRQDLMKLREDTTNTRDGFKTLDTAPKVITSQYSTYERNAHFPQTGSRKRSRLPNVEVEHEEPQDGMSLPKRRKDLSKSPMLPVSQSWALCW